MKIQNKSKVGDTTITGKIKDDKIIITNRNGRVTIGKYEILISKWREFNSSFGNPNSHKKRFIADLNKKVFPGNYINTNICFINRIEDAQIIVINNIVNGI